MRPTREYEYEVPPGAFPVVPDTVATPMRRRSSDATIAQVQLDFTVSQDEEHVRLALLSGSEVWDLGERVHHYALLLLVRMRMQASQRGIDPASAGWVASDDLAKMLGLSTTHLHIQLFRLRRQIVAAAPAAFAVVETRRGQLRAAAVAVRITQGSAVQVDILAGAPAAAR